MTIEELQLKIESDSHGAVSGIDSLTKSLQSLKAATANSAGLGKVSSSLQAIKTATQGLQLGNLGTQMGQLTAALKPLESLGKNNLSSFVNSLKAIPKVTENLDVATTNAFADAVQRVAAAVRPLATEMQKISNGFSAMPKKLQSFITQMDKSATSSYKAATGYKNMAAALNSINFKAAIAGLIYFGRRVVSIFGSMVSNASQYIEDINLVTVSLGEYAGAVSEYAQRAQDLLGIDAADFMRNTGVFNSIAQGLGVASDSAALMSQNLTQLAYDLASFYNISNDTAFEKLQSAITGQTKPMMELGVSVHQATLEEVALAHGITQSVASMSEAQKVALRYVAIMDATTKAQGDLAATLDTPANQMRIFSAQVQLLSRSLGNLLIPVINKVLPYLLAFVKVLRMVADAIASFFGFSLPTVDTSSIAAVSTGIGAAADNADNLTSGLGNAAKEAKKLKDYVMGFDELNIIKPEEPQETASSGGGAGGIGVGGGDLGIDLPQYDFLEGLSAQADELVDKMKPILAILGAIAAAILLIKAIVAGLKFLDLLSSLGMTLGGFLKIFAGLALAIAGAIAFVVGFVDAWKNGIDWQNLALMIGGLVAVVGGLALAFGPIAAAVAAVVGGIALLVIGVKDFIENGATMENTLTVMAGILAIAAGIALAVGGWIPLVIGAIVALVAAIAMNWDAVKAKTFEIWNAIKDFVAGIWDSIKATAETVWNAITGFFGNTWNTLKNMAIDTWTSVKNFFSTMWDGVKGVFSSSLDFIKNLFPGTYNAIKGVIDSIERIFKGLIDFVSGVFTGDWSRAWEGVVNIFGGIFSGIGNLFKTPINFVIDLINGFLRGLNNIKIPSWVPGVGGMGFSIPEIPKLNVGMDFVPANDYLAYLHYGEAVLTANDAAVWRSLGGTAGIQALAGEFTPGGGHISGLAMSNVSIQQPSQQGSNASEIAAAVYEAMLAANAQSTDRPIQVTVEMNGRQMFEENIRQDQTYGYPAFRQSAVNLG